MPYAGFFSLVDDLLLVAIDIRHHDSHHKIVLERKTVLRSMWKRSQLLLAAIRQLIRNPGLVDAGESVFLETSQYPSGLVYRS